MMKLKMEKTRLTEENAVICFLSPLSSLLRPLSSLYIFIIRPPSSSVVRL